MISDSGTLALLSSYRLPQSCSNGQFGTASVA
jgi:hypothetical protein